MLVTRSITHVPSIVIYCLVINLMVSWATMPPNKAAVVGKSEVGARELLVLSQLMSMLLKTRITHISPTALST